ncbi:MAG: MarR family transcriptional regulator [Candidatus Thorarchaeota archaeon]|nr:MarR family transcriptional regulator [Candidatus Thorarchaeota archaeon]
MNGLTGAYLSLLMAIQENPLSTVSDLVKRVEGSKPTIIKRLTFLRENKYFNVKALLNNHNLGFEPIDLLLDTKNLKAVEKLEKVATNHPYTVYRSRCFGSHNGLFLQFRTPIGTRNLIEELVKILRDDGVVTNDLIFSMGDEPTINSSMQLDCWDFKTMSWSFDWVKWFETDYEIIRSQKPKEKLGSALEWLTKNDMYILQQLMIGAKRHNADMIRSIEDLGISITPQTFGRRLKTLDEQCVEKYRVSFNPRAFDIITNIVIRGEGKRKYLRKLYSRMNKDPIPFESSFRVSDTELYWFVRMPPSHLSSLLTNLHSNLENMSVSIIDYSQSFLYSIWPETLDEDNHTWRQDRAFMIDQALK